MIPLICFTFVKKLKNMVKIHSKLVLLMTLITLLWCSDLSAQKGTIIINYNKKIDSLMLLKKELNLTEPNYFIQIYSGNRSGAEKAQIEFRKYFIDWSSEKKFETPNYKIWIGNFKTRLEADRALLKIKKKFKNAFIFKPKKSKI